MNKQKDIIQFLLQQQKVYHDWNFVENDPIQLPHTFSKKQDIEIVSFFATLFALGRRKIIIQKTNEFILWMDNCPFEFIKNFTTKDLNNFQSFAHRFFKYEDIIFLLLFLQKHYQTKSSLESAFTNDTKGISVFEALVNFQNNVFSTFHHKRSEKHISSPLSGSPCKRLNLLLRWLVRVDRHNIDFGLWNFIHPSDLIIPLDVHVLRVCKHLKIISPTAIASWKTAVDITFFLKKIDSQDLIKFDFAFMGMGINKALV